MLEINICRKNIPKKMDEEMGLNEKTVKKNSKYNYEYCPYFMY